MRPFARIAGAAICAGSAILVGLLAWVLIEAARGDLLLDRWLLYMGGVWTAGVAGWFVWEWGRDA